MVISSELNEKRPPGGSNFAGHFNSAAFAANIFPQRDSSGKGAFKHRLQRREHRELTTAGEAMHDASVEYTSYREPGRPSRLLSAYGETARQGHGAPSRPRLAASASLPAVGSSPEGWELHAGSVKLGPSGSTGEATASQPAGASWGGADAASAAQASDSQTAASLMMNTRWYPHPSTNRGSLKLTQPKALLMGVDPLKDTGHRCPFWEAEGHRFATVTSLPDAKPRIPSRSMRWSCSEAWNNPQNHFTMKITQTRRRAD